MNGWVTLEAIIKALRDNELKVLDAYHEKNPSPIYEKERLRLREEQPDDGDEEIEEPSDHDGPESDAE